MRSVAKNTIALLLVFTMVITLGLSAYASVTDSGEDTQKLVDVKSEQDQTGPTDPVDPAEPKGAEEPEDPVDPAEPKGAEEPEDPVDPAESKGAEEPEDPVDPAEPKGAEEPEDPVDPAEPTDPEDAVEPVEPVEPTDPIDPENPEGSVVPTDPLDPTNPIDPNIPITDYLEYTIQYYFTTFDGEDVKGEMIEEVSFEDPIVTFENLPKPEDLPEGYVIDETMSTKLPFTVTEEENVIEVYYIPPAPNVLEYTIYYSFTAFDGEDVKGEMKAEVSSADPVVTVDNLPMPEDLPMGYVIDEENSTLPYEVTEEDDEIYVYYVPGMMRSLMGGNIQALNYFPASGTSTNGHYSAIGVYIAPNGDVHILINELSGGDQYRFLNGTINDDPFLKTLDGLQNINQKTNPLPLSNAETITLPDNSTVNVTGNIRIWDFNIGPMTSSLEATNNLYIKNQADGYTIHITSLGINLSHDITKEVKIANDYNYVDRLTATIGDELIYRVIVNNTGDLSLSGINVYDDVPAGITILGVSENELPWDDPTWTEVSTSSGNVILKTNLTLAVNESKAYYIKAIVNEDAFDGQTITNTAFTGGSVSRKEDTANVDINAKKIDVTIEKFITGNLADLSKSFSFTVIVQGDEENPIDFSLSNGGTHEINNLPAGSILTLTEDAEGYDITVMVGSTVIDPNQDGSYTITLGDEDTTITVTNNKDTLIDTGISLDSLPYIIMLILAGLGTLGIFIRKRKYKIE